MQKRTYLLPLALSALLLAACNQQSNDSAKKESASPAPAATSSQMEESGKAPQDTSKVVATVNGAPITEDQLEMHLSRLRRQPALQGVSPAELKKASLEALVNQELLVQQAEKEGIDKRPDIIMELAQQRRGLLGNTLLRERLEASHFSDNQLKEEYGKLFATPTYEYKARHILLNSEQQARDVIAQLAKGANFAKLAKEKSIGPSKNSGGELGWISPKQVVPEFGAALATLDKGGYTKTPVKTQFGWHVIELEDKREVPPPPFEQVKPQLEQKLQRQALSDYIDRLRGKAKVDILLKDEAAPAPTAGEAPKAAEAAPANQNSDTAEVPSENGNANGEKPATENGAANGTEAPEANGTEAPQENDTSNGEAAPQESGNANGGAQ